MLPTNNTITSQTCVSILGSKHTTNSARTENWHSSQALLHLSQACFTIGFTGEPTNCTSRNLIRLYMPSVNAKQNY